MIKTLPFSLLSLLMMLFTGVYADTYSYSFDNKMFSAAGEVALGDITWKLDTDAGYFGYDSNNDKGQQIGSSSSSATYAVLSTSGISGTITSIKVNTSGASDIKATLDVTVGGKAFGSQYTLTKEKYDAEFTGSGEGEIKLSYANNSKKALYIRSIEVTYSTGGVVVNAPTFSLKGGIYTSEQLVTILAGSDCTIYYTTDGTVPTKESSVYSEPLYIGETTTLKAIAYDANGNASAVTTATYTLPVRCENIAAVKALEKGTLVALTLNDAQVVYVNSYKSGENTNTEYFVRDASGAIDFYNTGIELSANQIINGTLYAEYSPYNGLPELVKSDITDAKYITVVDGTEAIPTEVSVADLTGDKYLCDLVMVNNVHFTSEVSGKYTNYYILDAEGANKVMVYDKFKVGVEFPTNEDSKSYSVTGILGSASLSGKITNELFPIKVGDSVADGIADIEAATEAADTVVYNIAGQRLQKPQKGLNIINGTTDVIT